jgi:hypothetical protein
MGREPGVRNKTAWGMGWEVRRAKDGKGVTKSVGSVGVEGTF